MGGVHLGVRPDKSPVLSCFALTSKHKCHPRAGGTFRLEMSTDKKQKSLVTYQEFQWRALAGRDVYFQVAVPVYSNKVIEIICDKTGLCKEELHINIDCRSYAWDKEGKGEHICLGAKLVIVSPDFRHLRDKYKRLFEKGESLADPQGTAEDGQLLTKRIKQEETPTSHPRTGEESSQDDSKGGGPSNPSGHDREATTSPGGTAEESDHE